MKTEKKLLLLVVLVVLAVIVTKFGEKRDAKEAEQKKDIRFTQKANDREGIYWKYKLDTDTVIKETEYYESRFFLNFGHEYTQNWIFEVVNPGEVTVTWQEYEGGGSKGDSYSISYLFEENGEYTILLDSRKKWEKQLRFSHYASGSLGECWEYELSTEGILEETNYYTSWLGGEHYWVFTPIGEGEITIQWNLYEAYIDLNENESYSVTYYFDKYGNHTVLADTREKK